VPRPVLILALAIVVLIGAALVFGNHPSTSTVSNDTGTRVDAPGTRVETSDEGTRVQAPGVDITVPKKSDGE
jgi:hypothetical protein